MPPFIPRPRHADLSDQRVLPADRRAASDPSLPAQGYRLTIAGDGTVAIDTADPAGRHYAEVTLDQLTESDGTVPVGQITDWPDFPVRAVMLDISRGKVPTTATLLDLIDRLARWKINQVQLYMEHTFAYAGHEEVWADASPITPDEMAELAERCRTHHIDLVPNQNTLGHMERWLRHERYRPLAVSPDGFRFGDVVVRPMTLDPAKPGSLALARDLLGQLLAACPAERAHVGLDEPFELPPDQMADYGRYIGSLRAAPELAGREMLMWADIAIGHPELLPAVPDGVTMCVWGYDAGFPFAERMGAVAAAGLPQWVCPGTSSWNSVVGRWSNARANLLEAADAGRDFGAAGYLITDWGDNGHLQYLPFSWPGFAYGAAVSWCRDANRDVDVSEVCEAPIVDLADAFVDIEPKTPNSFILTALLYDPAVSLTDGRLARLSTADLDRLDRRLDRVGAAALDDDLVAAERDNAVRLVRLLGQDARLRMAGADRAPLAPLADDIAAVHEELWLARNRPGGLAFSAGILRNLAGAYRGEPFRRRVTFVQ